MLFRLRDEGVAAVPLVAVRSLRSFRLRSRSLRLWSVHRGRCGLHGRCGPVVLLCCPCCPWSGPLLGFLPSAVAALAHAFALTTAISLASVFLVLVFLVVGTLDSACVPPSCLRLGPVPRGFRERERVGLSSLGIQRHRLSVWQISRGLGGGFCRPVCRLGRLCVQNVVHQVLFFQFVEPGDSELACDLSQFGNFFAVQFDDVKHLLRD